MYDSIFSNAKLQKNIEDLADVLVPVTFRSEAPQYYELIKAFLANIQDVQSSVGNNFIDLIDIESITSNEILHLYKDTYIATLNLDAEFDMTQSKDIFKVSKDLSVRKGTPFLYGILINLLVFLFEGITNQYQELLDLVNSSDLTEDERNAILQDISLLQELGLTSSLVEVEEHPTEPFKYSVSADFSKDAFEKYVKPFCHPAGWQIIFYQVAMRVIREEIISYENFELFQTFYLPSIPADGSIAANQDDFLPLSTFLDTYPLGADTLYNTYRNKMIDRYKLYNNAGSVYYDFGKITTMKNVGSRNYTTVIENSVEKTDIRYSDSSWEFPGDLYTANMIYRSNNPVVKANTGFHVGYYGKLISYKHQLEYDQF